MSRFTRLLEYSKEEHLQARIDHFKFCLPVQSQDFQDAMLVVAFRGRDVLNSWPELSNTKLECDRERLDCKLRWLGKGCGKVDSL